MNVIMGNAYLYSKNKEMANAMSIVPKTSRIATLKNRYEWMPSLGFPRTSLYLQRDSI
jgi:hypothetical protein